MWKIALFVLGIGYKTITSAALIMVAVFTVFVFTGVPSVAEIGLGCAVAIAVDATIVRLVLVPALMELLGRWNWWLPARCSVCCPAARWSSRRLRRRPRSSRGDRPCLARQLRALGQRPQLGPLDRLVHPVAGLPVAAPCR